MICEIEFMPVGTGSKAGDAIILRYGTPVEFKLMLIDGGTADTGDEIVKHLKKHFGLGARLEHVVLTHSDADHASGLRTVLEQIPVNSLWLHVPWLLAPEVRHLFADTRWTPLGLQTALKREYDIISEIVDLALARRVTINQPFQGQNIGPFHVLSPNRAVYLHLLPQFEKTPDPNQAAIEAASMWLGKASLLGRLVEAARAKVENWTTETWAQERLKDGGQTSASNEFKRCPVRRLRERAARSPHRRRRRECPDLVRRLCGKGRPAASAIYVRSDPASRKPSECRPDRADQTGGTGPAGVLRPPFLGIRLRTRRRYEPPA